MFERFTDRARRVVVLSQEESRQLGHNYIGTEHLLLGLLAERDGVAAKVLESFGVQLEAVRYQVFEIIGRGAGPVAGHIPFTPRAKKVLELSLREALQLGHNYIGTEHILLGLVREGEGVAAQVLAKQGCMLDRVRQEVIRMLTEHPEAAGVRGSGEVEYAALEELRAQGAAELLSDEYVLPRLSGAVHRIDRAHDELRAIRRELEEIQRWMSRRPGESSETSEAGESGETEAGETGETEAGETGETGEMGESAT
jgi:ATP-dependent Clp protease ATP-binding subunit ClpC